MGEMIINFDEIKAECGRAQLEGIDDAEGESTGE